VKARLGLIFWGLLLVVLDLEVNGFDLLPDAIGYALVALGCGGLASLSPRFRVAALLCWMLAVLWLAGLLVAGDVKVRYGLAMMALNCTMMWCLLGGIADIALARARTDIAVRAWNRRVAYVAIMTIGHILPFFVGSSSDVAVPLVVVVVAIGLVAMAMILHLVNRVRVELSL
jgi:hypothetical protein